MTQLATEARMELAIASLREALQVAGTPARIQAVRDYLKLDCDAFGVSVPEVRRAVISMIKEFAINDHDEVVALAAKLWSSTVYEERKAAVDLLVYRRKVLIPNDLRRVETMLRSAGTWALVDECAEKVAGYIDQQFPVESAEYIDAWASQSESFWLRRSALLVLIGPLRKGVGDLSRFERYAVPMMAEKEFFIGKAIGWVLRDASRKQPEMVRAFAEKYSNQLSALSLREATRTLPPIEMGVARTTAPANLRGASSLGSNV